MQSSTPGARPDPVDKAPDGRDHASGAGAASPGVPPTERASGGGAAGIGHDGETGPAAPGAPATEPASGTATDGAGQGETCPEPKPTRKQVRRWRRYLADEVQEAGTYRDLASRSTPAERDILEGLAEAEERHAGHWRELLGAKARETPKRRFSTDLLAFMAKHFGFVFALAIAGRAETRTRYSRDPSVPAAMTADEQIHSEVIRGLAERGRARISGTFRAAVFGANDGLVSNLSLVLGMGGTGVSAKVVMATGIAGLLSGAMSMAAGEYVSVDSQRALLNASNPDPKTSHLLGDLDIKANELALVYRARGLSEDQANARAQLVLTKRAAFSLPGARNNAEVVGSGLKAAIASFCFFSSGAIIPVIPYFCGLTGLAAVIWAAALVGCGLAVTGMYAGILSGTSPLKKGARQIAIGWAAAAVTYLLGLAFGTAVS
ncbi:MAG: VIT1/CCC1 family protein [Bifidobacteriaceae bacterium]|jgi:VIT1/CCC1 family predicted Fe2+/Mn2+ transporter|nr:VIT1/CCC1 family protein [Bifidobacteriaceae bacterium]